MAADGNTSSRGGAQIMINVDAYYLYQVGTLLHPLTEVSGDWTKAQVRNRLWSAVETLDTLLNRSVYRLQTCRSNGEQLLRTVSRIQAELSAHDVDLNQPIGFLDAFFLNSEAQAFETVLAAELKWGRLYLVLPKGGYDLMQLTENGIAIFPRELAEKAPEAIVDAKQAARCIAFELSTAAAFHCHRVNEIVLRRYYTYVTGGKDHPEKKSIRSYVDAMKGYKVGDKVVFGALMSLNNLHRNPVLHPEHSVDTIDEAIALLNSVHSVVTYMLKGLEPAPLQLTPPPSAVAAIGHDDDIPPNW